MTSYSRLHRRTSLSRAEVAVRSHIIYTIGSGWTVYYDDDRASPSLNLLNRLGWACVTDAKLGIAMHECFRMADHQ